MTPPGETPTTVRLTPAVLKRADALARVLQRHPEASMWGRISRSTVLRLAVVRGLEVLESEYGVSRKPRRRQTRKQ